MKTRTIAIFDPGSIELTITGAIKKNTLPEVRGAWTAWLASFDAKNLETDEQFADAAKSVTELKRVEERLDGIRETVLKGNVFAALKELEEMKETTRQKRLEFDRAVTTRKNDLKAEAIAKAMKALAEALAAFPHRRQPRNGTETPDALLFAAIKGKSAILKMQEALETESARIVAEAKEYNDTFERTLYQVNKLYADVNEAVTDSELDMLVKTHFTEAPERAKFILQQKKVARDQAALDAQKKQPEPAPAAQEERGAGPLGMTMKKMRVGATFTVANEATIRTRIQSIGGTDVVFKDFPKEEQ